MATYNLTFADTVLYPIATSDTVGPWLLGILASTLLVGIISGQVHAFIQSARNGEFAMHERVIVAVVAVGTLISWCSQIHVAWFLFVQHWGSPSMLLRMPDGAYATHIAATSVIVAGCQTFFAIRAWRLNGESPILGAIFIALVLFVAASRLALAICYGRASISEGKDIIEIVNSLQVPLNLSFFSSAGVDILLFLAISVKLWSHRRRNAYKETDGLLLRVFQLSLTTSALTTAAATTVAILFLTKGQAALWGTFIVHISSRLFATSLLFTLNSREFLRDGGSASYARRKARFAHTDMAFKSRGTAHQMTGIDIAFEVHVDAGEAEKGSARLPTHSDSKDSLGDHIAQLPVVAFSPAPSA